MVSSAEDVGPEEDEEQSFMSHLFELRGRILRAVLCVLAVFLCLVGFANEIYAAMAAPLMKHLAEGATMIAIDAPASFLAPLKLTLFASLFISLPYVFYQAWAFVAPGLYKNEQRLVYPLLASSVGLFYTGMAFAYFAVFPPVFQFLANAGPDGVTVTPDITRHLNFVLKLFFAFGLAFEVPIATILLIKTGFASVEQLKRYRPYVFLGAFVVGMLLTPPDPISQVMLAIPVWLLFEAGLLLARFVGAPPVEE